MLANIKKSENGWLRLVQLLVVIGMMMLVGQVMRARLSAKSRSVGPLTPYTVILRETTYGADGIGRASTELIEAIRSDGSRLISSTELGRLAEGRERHLIFASGVQVIVNDRAKLKSSTNMQGVLGNRAVASIWRDPVSKCLNSFDGKPFGTTAAATETVQGEEVVAGYRAIKLASNSGSLTRWLALDYGCAVLKDRLDFGSGKGHSEHQLISFVVGEPDSVLFEIPDDAKEVPPSVRLKASMNSDCLNSSCVEKLAERLRKMDEEYFRRRVVEKISVQDKK